MEADLERICQDCHRHIITELTHVDALGHVCRYQETVYLALYCWSVLPGLPDETWGKLLPGGLAKLRFRQSFEPTSFCRVFSSPISAMG